MSYGDKIKLQAGRAPGLRVKNLQRKECPTFDKAGGSRPLGCNAYKDNTTERGSFWDPSFFAIFKEDVIEYMHLWWLYYLNFGECWDLICGRH
jgi:hypothetical protein